MLLTNKPRPPVPIRNSTAATLRTRKQAKIGRPVANRPSSPLKISSSVIHQVMSDFRNDLVRRKARPEHEIEDGKDQAKARDGGQPPARDLVRHRGQRLAVVLEMRLLQHEHR